jgi:hypothetical protein
MMMLIALGVDSSLYYYCRYYSIPASFFLLLFDDVNVGVSDIVVEVVA